MRAQRSQLSSQNKTKRMAENYQKAESIRQEELALKQAKFFNGELRKMTSKEKEDQTFLEYNDKLEQVNQRLASLESIEANMLENLASSVNEHSRLTKLSITGELNASSIRESKKRLKITQEKPFNQY